MSHVSYFDFFSYKLTYLFCLASIVKVTNPLFTFNEV